MNMVTKKIIGVACIAQAFGLLAWMSGLFALPTELAEKEPWLANWADPGFLAMPAFAALVFLIVGYLLVKPVKNPNK